MNKATGIASAGVPALAGISNRFEDRLKPGLQRPGLQRSGPQRGFTLVEMLAVIATGGVLLVIATGVVHRAMRVEKQWRSQANVSRAFSRLADDFRNDVHRCQDLELAAESAMLTLTSPDGSVVTYEIAADEIIRDIQSPGTERRREFYAKPVDCQAEFAIQDQSRWVQLLVTRDLRLKGIEPRIVLHVEAEAGRLARLTGTSGGTP